MQRKAGSTWWCRTSACPPWTVSRWRRRRPSRFPGLRILLVTGYADQRERAAELNGVIVDVVQKPFTLAEIRERVARALA